MRGEVFRERPLKKLIWYVRMMECVPRGRGEVFREKPLKKLIWYVRVMWYVPR